MSTRRNNLNNMDAYFLSNSPVALHFEKNIQISPLGELFNAKLTALLGFEVVATNLFVNRDSISVFIKERGKEGGMFGSLFSHTDNNILCIDDPTCACVWKALCDSFDEMEIQFPELYVEPRKDVPKKLNVTIDDFVKRSRMAFFMDNAVYIEKKLNEKYPNLSFSLRIQDDIHYFYLIFSTDEDMRKATEEYGIENMNNFVWELCKQEDTYGVFDLPLPDPIVTTRKEIIQSGKAMEIMRNNPDFETL